MTIIDRYVLTQFIRILCVSFLSLTGLFVVIDAIGNLDEFLSMGEAGESVPAVLADYYGPRVLSFFDRTCALLSLIAAIFVVTWLQRSNELTALMAAGISKLRVVRPLVYAVGVVALLGVINREMLLPTVRDDLTRNAQNLDGDRQQTLQPRYDNRTDILLAGRHTVARDQRIADPAFRLPRTFRQFGKQLLAETAYYRAASDQHPSGYLLTGVTQPADIDTVESAELDGRPAILTARDAPWLKPGECFVASDISFEQLAAGKAWKQFSSSLELIRGLHSPSHDFGADVRVTVHARFVQPLLDVTLLFLGLPLVLAGENRNIFVATGKCLLMVAGFFLVILTCHALGSNYLVRPALAAWLPLLVFGPIAYGLCGAINRK